MIRDATVFWINTTEKEIHFIDGIVSAYDGLANVRREYRLQGGKRYFKVYVAPGMEDEFMALMQRLQRVASIPEVLEEKRDVDPPTV